VIEHFNIYQLLKSQGDGITENAVLSFHLDLPTELKLNVLLKE
jgi:hypothetical protein